MSAAAKRIVEAVLQLEPEEREQIAEEIWASLDSTGESAEKAWAREVEARIKDIDEGRVKPVPWEEARDRIAASLRRSRTP